MRYSQEDLSRAIVCPTALRDNVCRRLSLLRHLTLAIASKQLPDCASPAWLLLSKQLDGAVVRAISGKGFGFKPADQGGQQAPSLFLWGRRLFGAFALDFPACGGRLLVFRLLRGQNNTLSHLLTSLCSSQMLVSCLIITGRTDVLMRMACLC